jgi:hypothetical protein
MARNQPLNSAERARIAELDSLNFDLSRMREATRGANAEDYGMQLSRLSSAYAKNAEGAAKVGNTTELDLIGPARRVLGATPRQDEARSSLVTARRIAAPVLLAGGGAAAGGLTGALAVPAALYGVSALGQTARGAKHLLGENDWQKAMAQALRSQRAQALMGGVAASQDDISQ